jgi:hypothetical protein
MQLEMLLEVLAADKRKANHTTVVTGGGNGYTRSLRHESAGALVAEPPA